MLVDGDVGHPQGITKWGEDDASWLVSTVHPQSERGELIVVGADGSILAAVDVTDGERFHPGGMSADRTGCWVAVAEYRPDSTTVVHRFDRDLNIVTSFPFGDHLGAICELDDNTLFAVVGVAALVPTRRRRPTCSINATTRTTTWRSRISNISMEPMWRQRPSAS